MAMETPWVVSSSEMIDYWVVDFPWPGEIVLESIRFFDLVSTNQGQTDRFVLVHSIQNKLTSKIINKGNLSNIETLSTGLFSILKPNMLILPDGLAAISGTL